MPFCLFSVRVCPDVNRYLSKSMIGLGWCDRVAGRHHSNTESDCDWEPRFWHLWFMRPAWLAAVKVQFGWSQISPAMAALRHCVLFLSSLFTMIRCHAIMKMK